MAKAYGLSRGMARYAAGKAVGVKMSRAISVLLKGLASF